MARGSNATITSQVAATTTVPLLASNTDRKLATVYNDSTAAMYLQYGVVASTTLFTVKIFSTGYYVLESNYTGPVSAVWDTATGNARITEVS